MNIHPIIILFFQLQPSPLKSVIVIMAMAMCQILHSYLLSPPPTPPTPPPKSPNFEVETPLYNNTNNNNNSNNSNSTKISSSSSISSTRRRRRRRSFIFQICSSLVVTTTTNSLSAAVAETPSSNSSSFLSGIGNTRSWFQFYGDGFAIRVPPNFQDITEPEDYNAGLSLYGDKAKPKTYAARFASSDGSEVLSVVIRPSNQLKITFLEAKDIADLGSLKEAAKIFVPVEATLYSARTIKIKEDEGYRNYYFYEFGSDVQRVALVAAVNSGKAVIAGVTAPRNKWDDDGVRLRSAAVSLTLL